MRINTNIAANEAYSSLRRVNGQVSASMAKLSSGFRINKAGDDAAGLGIANTLRAGTRALIQASKNAEQATAALSVAEGGLQTVGKIVERMKEIVSQAGSDNTDQAGRDAIRAEYIELVTEIDAIVSTTKFGGATLLDGTFAGSFLVRSSGDYTGDDLITLGAVDVTTATLTLAAAPAAGADAATYRGILDEIDVAIGVVNTALGSVGAAQNRIGYALESVRAQVTNFTAAESVIRDVDMAEEMTTFTKNQILSQAGTAMLAQANQSAQGILQLLRG